MTVNAIMIRPIDITADMLVSTNAVETAEVFDGSGPPYAQYYLGAIIQSAESNHLYESLVGTGFDSKICSITNADPAVATTTSPHELEDGDIITFSVNCPGTYPAAIEPGTPYAIRYLTSTTFNLYDSATNPDTSSLLSTAGNAGSGLLAFASYDMNTGWWGDPGDPTFDATVAAYAEWVTQPRWLDRGPTKPWGMFDGYNGTATVNEDGLEVVIEPGTRVDALGFHDLLGATLSVVVESGATVEYNQTIALVDNSDVIDWYTFFFAERRPLRSLILDDLPGYVISPRITISGPTRIGNCSLGRRFEIGVMQLGVNLGTKSYSTISVDETFGNYTVTRRRTAKKSSGQAFLPNGRIDIVKNTLDDYDGVPVFWRLKSGLSSAVLFGFYRNLNVEISYHQASLVSIEIEGVI